MKTESKKSSIVVTEPTFEKGSTQRNHVIHHSYPCVGRQCTRSKTFPVYPKDRSEDRCVVDFGEHLIWPTVSVHPPTHQSPTSSPSPTPQTIHAGLEIPEEQIRKWTEGGLARKIPPYPAD